MLEDNKNGGKGTDKLQIEAEKTGSRMTEDNAMRTAAEMQDNDNIGGKYAG